jgi:hypothetical protein
MSAEQRARVQHYTVGAALGIGTINADAMIEMQRRLNGQMSQHPYAGMPPEARPYIDMVVHDGVWMTPEDAARRR